MRNVYTMFQYKPPRIGFAKLRKSCNIRPNALLTNEDSDELPDPDSDEEGDDEDDE
jgi:hypothetical protein